MSIVRATLWSNLGEAVQLRNVFTYSGPGLTLNEGDKTAIWARIVQMVGAVAPYLSTVWATESVHFEELTEGVWQPRGEISLVDTGDRSGDLLPFMNSLLVLGVTGFAKTLGKKYLGGVVEEWNIDGAIAGNIIAAATSFLAYYLSNAAAEGGRIWIPGTVSKSGVFHAFIAGRVNDLFATQRRRHPSVGI
jgi:hypothetical protein